MVLILKLVLICGVLILLIIKEPKKKDNTIPISNGIVFRDGSKHLDNNLIRAKVYVVFHTLMKVDFGFLKNPSENSLGRITFMLDKSAQNEWSEWYTLKSILYVNEIPTLATDNDTISLATNVENLRYVFYRLMLMRKTKFKNLMSNISYNYNLKPTCRYGIYGNDNVELGVLNFHKLTLIHDSFRKDFFQENLSIKKTINDELIVIVDSENKDYVESIIFTKGKISKSSKKYIIDNFKILEEKRLEFFNKIVDENSFPQNLISRILGRKKIFLLQKIARKPINTVVFYMSRIRQMLF